LTHSQFKDGIIWEQSQFQDVQNASMFTSASKYNLGTYTDQLFKTKLECN